MSRELLIDFGQNGSRSLKLQLVVAVNGTLENGGSGIDFTGLSFSRAHDDINAINLIDLESELFDLLINLGTVDDDVVSIEAVVLNLVAQNTLKWLDLERFSTPFDDVGDISVGLSRTEETSSALRGIVGSTDYIRHSASSRGSLSNDPGVSSQGRESVNVGTELSGL